MSALCHEQRPEHRGIEQRLAQAQAEATKRGAEERPFHGRRVGDEDTTRHRLEQGDDGLAERGRLLEVDGPDAVDDDRGLGQSTFRPGEPVQALARG